MPDLTIIANLEKTLNEMPLHDKIGVVGAELVDMISKAKQKAVDAVHKRKITPPTEACNFYRTKVYDENGKRIDIRATSLEKVYDSLYVHYFPVEEKPETVGDVQKRFSEYRHSPQSDGVGGYTDPTTTPIRLDQEWRKYWANTKLATMPIKNVTSADIRNAFAEIFRNSTYNCGHFSGAKSILNQIFKFAFVEGTIEFNPMPDIVGADFGLPDKGVSETRTTADDRKKLWEYLSEKPNKEILDYAVMFWLTTPKRVGEWSMITWDDVDITNRVVHIYHSNKRRIGSDGHTYRVDENTLKSNGKAHIISLTDEQIEVLTELKNVTGECHYVFQTRGKFPPSTNRINKRIGEVCDSVGISHLTTHDNRRGIATDLLDANVEVNKVAALLNNDPKTTQKWYDKTLEKHITYNFGNIITCK